MKRNTQQRRRQIIETLGEMGETSVESLAALYATSEVTIRKDLAALELNGLVLRRFGGAILMPPETLGINQSAEQRDKVSSRKKSIGERAAELIHEHARIVVDSGSTTSAMLPYLKDKRGLVVMTNSIATAQELLELDPEPTVLVTGGTWDTQSQSLQGTMAEKMVASYNFDFAFVGASGVDLERGTTSFNELTQLTRSMAQASREVVVMAESQKFTKKMPNVELPWQQISKLITDDELTSETKTALQEKGVDVDCVNTNE